MSKRMMLLSPDRLLRSPADHRKRWSTVRCAVLVLALLLPTMCLAQGTGVIYGTVTDPSGASIAGAKVEAVLTDRGTTRDGTTGSAGEYVFSAMQIGAYEIRVSATGFQQSRRTGQDQQRV